MWFNKIKGPIGKYEKLFTLQIADGNQLDKH